MRKKDDEKQQRIKAAVMQLSLEEGFAGTSISKIAKKAGVSPATVYIYYANKDEMLRDIYSEYAEESYSYLYERTDAGMSADELIESLMRSYYQYIQEHADTYSFIEQFSNCPVLMSSCRRDMRDCDLIELLEDKEKSGEIRQAHIGTILAVMFSPVRAVVKMKGVTQEDESACLEEIIELVKHALLN